MMDKTSLFKIRDDILAAVLPDVPFDGWNWDGVLAGCEEAGYGRDMAAAVFPGKMNDVLDSFYDRADRLMIEALSSTDPEALRVRDRVKTALVKRFEILRPDAEALRQSMTYWSLPHRAPRAARLVWRTADRIWNWAGDEAADYNRYTKRALLSGIIVSSTLAWLDDPDHNMIKLEEFVDRRIGNVMTIGKIIGKYKKRA